MTANIKKHARAVLILGLAWIFGLDGAFAAPDTAEPRPDGVPLSPAQTALFDTPHLRKIDHPETLLYAFDLAGPGAFTDKVAVEIVTVHPDGTKYVGFDYLTGAHHVFFPAVDPFSGNPLLMVFLEHDVREMKDQFGVAAAYFRNQVRAAFVDRAQVTDTRFDYAGQTVAAKQITVSPFQNDPRFEKLPALRNKLYTFVLSDAVPGELAELRAEMPADPESGQPAWSETLRFTGVKS
jgi:hypothetical protein